MKKKSVLGFILLSSLLLILGACGKSLEPKEAAEVFMNRIMYNKDKEKYSQNFKSSKAQEEEINKFSENFSEGMLSGLSSSGMDTSESKEKVDAISEKLLSKLRSETSFTVKSAEKTKEGAEVTYSIKGLDIMSAYSQMINDMLTEVSEDPTKYSDGDEQAILDLALDGFLKAIDNIEPTDKAVDVTINFQLEKGKWYVPESEESNLQTIGMALVSGYADEIEFQTALQEVLTTAMQEFE